MGFLDLFRRRRTQAPVEQRDEFGSSAIPGPTEGAPGTYASTLAELRTAESSLQAVAVWSACDLIASIASQLPLDTYQRQSGGAQPKQIPNGKFVQDPGGEGYGVQDWIYQYLMSKLLRGNAYGRQLSPDPSTGYPTQIVLYSPDCVYGWRDRVDGMARWYVDGKQVPAKQMWHRRSYPMPGVLLGLSPVAQHAVTIGQGMAASRFGLQFFTDGGVPGGILRNTETTVDQTLAARVKAKWMAVVHGSREPAVLGKGWEWQGVTVNPEESQFLETQQYTSAQCARIFGPNVAEILGYETGGSMTYNTMVDRDLSFLKYTLNRWLIDMETTVFTPNLPKPQFVKFNRAALLSMDLLSRYRSYQIGISSKFLTPDEAREHEDRAPLTEEQKRELAELDVKAPKMGGEDGDPATSRAPGDAGPKERRAQPDDDDDLDDVGPLDDMSLALLAAIAELVDEAQARGWDPAKHPRNPKGTPGGGRFRSMADRLKDAIIEHLNAGRDGHPFDAFDREQLRKVARARGIALKRGEDRDSIAAKLLDHIKAPGKKEPPALTFDERADLAAQEGEALAAAPLSMTRADDLDRMSAEERSVLSQYKGTLFANLNGALRRERGDLPGSFGFDYFREASGTLDGLLGRSKLTSDVLVFRGIKDGASVFGAEAWGRSLVGGGWTEYGYLSTSADLLVARNKEFLTDDGATIAILVPRKVGALQLSGPEYESELLLQRGLPLRVVSDSGPGPERIIEVEVLE